MTIDELEAEQYHLEELLAGTVANATNPDESDWEKLDSEDPEYENKKSDLEKMITKLKAIKSAIKSNKLL